MFDEFIKESPTRIRLRIRFSVSLWFSVISQQRIEATTFAQLRPCFVTNFPSRIVPIRYFFTKRLLPTKPWCHAKSCQSNDNDKYTTRSLLKCGMAAAAFLGERLWFLSCATANYHLVQHLNGLEKIRLFKVSLRNLAQSTASNSSSIPKKTPTKAVRHAGKFNDTPLSTVKSN